MGESLRYRKASGANSQSEECCPRSGGPATGLVSSPFTYGTYGVSKPRTINTLICPRVVLSSAQ